MTAATHSFRSDNNAGLCPEAIAALVAAASGHAVGYGDDPWTAEGVAAIRGLFGDPAAAVFFVASGTAANTLAVAALTEPWQRVLCHSHAHWNDDESTAPERMTMCRTTPISPRAEATRLSVADVERALVGLRGDVHQPTPGVLTLSNPTEFGTVYRPEALRALVELAHARGFAVHVDGARFANAVAFVAAELGCSGEAAARALTVEAGIDALSLGGTKNGLACGEAVVFFGEAGARAAARFPFLRKSSGHLLSKHRFVSAPFAATLTSGAWLVHAGRANARARLLAAGLCARGLAPAFPCEANGVFLQKLPARIEAGLRARGHGFYAFASPLGELARLMCSFDTTEAAVAGFLSDLDAQG